jgi:hypothetical protein
VTDMDLEEEIPHGEGREPAQAANYRLTARGRTA